MINKLKKYKYVTLNLIYTFFSVGCILLSTFTRSGQLDYLLSDINNPNQHNYYNGFVSPYVKISKNDDYISESGIRYNDLLSHFYYNSFSNGCREVVDNSISVSIDEKIGVKLVTQNVFQIFDEKNSSGLYTVDMNMFYSYFSMDDIKDVMKDTYHPRNDCDTFAYISDTLADKLVNYYGLENKENPYLELIKNDNYSTLCLDVDGVSLGMKVCINSVLSSKHRFAPQIQKIYGDFALIYINSSVMKYIKSTSFDIDLKVNQYGNNKALSDINAIGYNTKNSNFSFYSYDYEKKCYLHNESFDQRYLDINSNIYISEIIFDIFFILGLVCLVLVSRLQIKEKSKRTMLLFFLPGCEFVIYCFIAMFFNLYYLYSLFFILALAIIIFMNWKEVLNDKNGNSKTPEYFEITI